MISAFASTAIHSCFNPKRSPIRRSQYTSLRFTAVTQSDSSRPLPTSIISWNVNSLRALLRKDPLSLQNLADLYKPDILCLQETKLRKNHEALFFQALQGYKNVMFNSSSTRLGYSGTAIYSRHDHLVGQDAINHEVGDDEARVLMMEFSAVFIVNVYTVNSGAGLNRLQVRLSWDAAFRKYIRLLRHMGKPVIVVGDLNVAHRKIDVHDPDAVSGSAGFTMNERTSFEDLLDTGGLVDAFRMFYPDRTGAFTFWDYRSKARQANRGWRIDYALVSDDMVDAVRDVRILEHVQGSDHCPVAIDLAPGFLV